LCQSVTSVLPKDGEIVVTFQVATSEKKYSQVTYTVKAKSTMKEAMQKLISSSIGQLRRSAKPQLNFCSTEPLLL